MNADIIVMASTGHQALTTTLFLGVVAITIGITFWASRQTSGAADYYAGGRGFSGLQNGLAIGGDYMSAASFLGISGAIALCGLRRLPLLDRLPRRLAGRAAAGRRDAAQLRPLHDGRPARLPDDASARSGTAAATSTVVVSIFYLLAQMVGAGALVALLLGVDSDSSRRTSPSSPSALLMVFYVTVGGMKGTTWVQIVKAVLLMAGSALIVVLVLAKFDFNLSDLLGTAASNSGKGQAFLEPGLKYGVSDDQQDRLPQPRHRPGARHGRVCRTS